MILFDDVDDIFLGADKDTYPIFVEGLARAAKTLNLKFGRHLHFIVFMKYGIFRAFYEKPLDYEKVRSFIGVLKWSEEELERMLARRIADKLALEKDPADVWALIFRPSTQSSIRSIRKFLFERCAGGPRDVIHYCNKAIELGQKPEITLQTLQACEDEFSRDKLTQIYSDFGYIYPGIDELIKKCFQGANATYSNKGFHEFILTQILGEQKVADLFGRYSYFDKGSVDQMIQIFFTVGLIGYASKAGAQVVYVLSDPRGSDLFGAAEYTIHPAFRKALRISS